MNPSQNPHLVDIEKIRKMLFDDDRYVLEFAKASIESFSEFSGHYSEYLVSRDFDNLQRAGHKIKPVAQMIGVEQLIEEYHIGKELLNAGKPKRELKDSVNRVQILCNKIISQFRNIVKQME